MKLSRQIIGRCAVLDSEHDSVQVDLTSIIRKLVFFDLSILNSIRLKELPYLVTVFGVEGSISLVQSDAMRIHCDAFTVAQTGQTNVLKCRVKKGILPLGSYAFSSVSIADWGKYIDECLGEVDNLDEITFKERSRLKNLLNPDYARSLTGRCRNPLTPSSEAIFSHKSDCGRSGRGVGGLFYRANGKAKPYLSKRDRPLPCSPGYCQCHLE